MSAGAGRFRTLVCNRIAGLARRVERRMDRWMGRVGAEPAYIVVSGSFIDREGLGAYAAKAGPLAERAGIQILGFSDSIEPEHVLEGEWPYPGYVIVERFPSMEVLLSFWNSDGYQQAKKLRDGKAKNHFAVAVHGQPNATPGVAYALGRIEADPKLLRAFIDADDGQAVVMINMLRFRERADYPDDFDAKPCTGREAFERYRAASAHHAGAVGARLVWGAHVHVPLIGPAYETWDWVQLVEFPNRQAFGRMVDSPDFQATLVHRRAAVADSRLIATTAQPLDEARR